MNSSVYRLRLDLHEATAQDCVTLNKGETNRRIEIELYENNAPWEFDGSVTAAICISGEEDIFPVDIEGNKVVYEPLGELTGTVGIREVQVRIMESGNTSVDPDEPNTDKLLYTPRFTAIINDVVNDGTETTEQARQGDLIAQINGVIDKADEGGFDGYSPTVTVEPEILSDTTGWRVTITDKDGEHEFDILNGVKGDTGEQGEPGADGEDGAPGDDGFSPEVTVTPAYNPPGHNVNITSKDSEGDIIEQTFLVADGQDGEDGADGEDGYSPTVTVTAITGGHRVTITDADGPHTFDVLDGQGGGADVPVLLFYGDNPTSEEIEANAEAYEAYVDLIGEGKPFIARLEIAGKTLENTGYFGADPVFTYYNNTDVKHYLYRVYATGEISVTEAGAASAKTLAVAPNLSTVADFLGQLAIVNKGAPYPTEVWVNEKHDSAGYLWRQLAMYANIPTKISTLENDSGFVNAKYVDNKVYDEVIASTTRTLKFYENRHPSMRNTAPPPNDNSIPYHVQGMGCDGEYIYIVIRSYYSTDNSYPSTLRKIRLSDGVVVDYIPYNTGSGIHVGHGGDIACRDGKLFISTSTAPNQYDARAVYIYDSDWSAYYTGERVESDSMLYYADSDGSHYHIPANRYIAIDDATYGFSAFAASVGGLFDKDGNAVSYTDMAVGSIAYDSVNDLFIVGLNNDIGLASANRGYKLYDSKGNIYRMYAILRYNEGAGGSLGSFTHVKTIGCYDQDDPLIAQGTDTDGKYIYQIYFHYGENYIVAFDYDGNFVYKYDLGSIGESQGICKISDNKYLVDYDGGATSGETIADVVINELTATFAGVDKFAPAGAIMKLEREIQNALYIDSEVTL